MGWSRAGGGSSQPYTRIVMTAQVLVRHLGGRR